MNPSDQSGQPPNGDEGNDGAARNAAADLIRQRLNDLYDSEPSSTVEEKIAVATPQPRRSKHQQYLYELHNSGKSEAEIHAAWHEYYQQLSDDDKHAVWNEFRAGQGGLQPAAAPGDQHDSIPSLPETKSKPAILAMPAQTYYNLEKFVQTIKRPKPRPETRSVAEIKQHILATVKNTGNPKARQHIKSLAFGLGVGSVVMLILLAGFFNERFIAPLITPSRSVSATPIIIDNNQVDISDPNPKVIIPKINVEIPVVYDEPSVAEDDIQRALERGVVHYATTPAPGEQGNSVIFGHSSNNIFNQGKYKFAFVLLSRLEIGDTFYLTKDSKRYAYKVYEKKIVKPTAVEVMGPTDKTATATLITCDPPGTSLNRLVVIGEQISPDPSGNAASSVAGTDSPQPAEVPSDAPSLWERLTSWR